MRCVLDGNPGRDDGKHDRHHARRGRIPACYEEGACNTAKLNSFRRAQTKKREAPACPVLNRYTRLIDKSIIPCRRERVTKAS